jgi:hypothetical protein
MSLLSRQRACALLLTLGFVMGITLGSIGLSGAAHCRQCPPGCPMHSGRLGCHHAAAADHHAREPGVRCACESHSETATATTPALRALLAVRSTPQPLFAQWSLTSAIRPLITQFVLEPPTDPPRASLV